jgi:hypothetical protein
MHRSLLLAALLTCAIPVQAADDSVQARYLEESRKTAQEFMQTLGSTLKKQLEAGGPESAIGVCKQIAPALAAEYSREGRLVKRVSLKPRNTSLGTPDAWETRRLESFERDQTEGKPLSGMEFSEVREEAGGRWFRYIRAIPTQNMCLQCHGQSYQISDGVKALLAKEYPEDKAVGYSAGMIRGAVSIKQKLD